VPTRGSRLWISLWPSSEQYVPFHSPLLSVSLSVSLLSVAL
jgi:hypothetical protein